MCTGNRIREIYTFYTRKTQRKIKEEYLKYFGVHSQTFQNKMNPNSHHKFTGEELAWFEEFVKKNGGPTESQITKAHIVPS